MAKTYVPKSIRKLVRKYKPKKGKIEEAQKFYLPGERRDPPVPVRKRKSAKTEG